MEADGERRSRPPQRRAQRGGESQVPDKTSAAERAIRTLVKRGEPITFQAVSREAGVSHAFPYTHQDLRRRIQHLRDQVRPSSAPSQRAETTDTVVLALTSQIDQLKKQHRQRVQALRAALEQAHGENLDLRRELARRGTSPRPASRP